jgi:hypothetical protein
VIKRAKLEGESQISTTLKEAIAESLLTNLHQAVSGGSVRGRVVLGSRPSVRYVSGFLESIAVARNSGSVVDETANPIHTITMGMDFQVVRGGGAVIHAKPKGAVYVRVLPTTQDLINNTTKLTLQQGVRRDINGRIQEEMEKFGQERADLLESDKNAFYRERSELRRNLMGQILRSQLGVRLDPKEQQKDVNAATDEKEELDGKLLKEGESITEGNESEKDGEEDATDGEVEFFVFPGMASVIPSAIVKEVKPLQRWVRIDLDNLPELKLEVDAAGAAAILEDQLSEASALVNQAIRQRLLDWINDADAETGGLLWAFPKNLTVTCEEIQHWDDKLTSLRAEFHSKKDPSLFALPQINLQWAVEVDVNHDDPAVWTLRMALENRTDTPDWKSVEFEESVFLAELEVRMDQSYHRSISLDRIKPSYRYNEYLHQPALGFNVGVIKTGDENELRLRTTWMPTYRQPRIRPLPYDGINVDFDALQTVAGTRALVSLPDRFKQWIDETIQKTDPVKGVRTKKQEVAEKECFADDCKQWRMECDKIRAGIQMLCDSATAYEVNPNDCEAIPYKAWSLMNVAMGQAAKLKGFTGWRLFQVAFVLANIPGLVSRMDEFHDAYDSDWDERVALLYFATGGGKTESFFGLLVFNLFLDRMRGKENGVTALIRYPLRLLTIQQAQRLAKTLAMAEQVRWAHGIEGQPFTIGFWVGGGNTPNRRQQVTTAQVPTFRSPDNPSEQKLLGSNDYVGAMESWNKLPSCPFCGGKTVLRRYSHRNGLIGHACINSPDQCGWNKRHQGAMKEPLPFYIVDDDIYDTAPSVVLGTIDKLALIGHRATTIRRVMGMFGLAPMRDDSSSHLVPLKAPSELRSLQSTRLAPFFSNGASFFHDPFPSIIIQDEAHLLEESLGTFSGIFQTTLERMFQEIGSHPRLSPLVAKVPGTQLPRAPKIVAASATVTEPERQMEDLYQRKVAQFPYPGPTLYESFYAAPFLSGSTERNQIEDIEVRARTARYYASLCTNGRPHTSVSVEILGNFHLLITELMQGLAGSDPEQARQRLLDGLGNSVLRDLYREEIETATVDALATVVDLHRVALTYVTNKKGGDQIMAAEGDTTARIHEDAGIEAFDGLHSELISGGVSAGEIERVISLAETRPKEGEMMPSILSEGLLRSVVATSAISHGVDVDEFNSMFFAGMPSEPAEYVQSSSRVGRTHVGVSILIPTPQRRRDRYILETHDLYHRFLERMIRPAAVNRWAENAMVRTLPSLIQAYLIGVREALALLDAEDEEKHLVDDHERIPVIARIINQLSKVNFRKEVSSFLDNAIGLGHSTFAPSAADKFKLILNDELREIVDFLDQNQKEFLGLEDLFKQLDSDDRRKKKLPMTSLRDVDPAGLIEYVPERRNSAPAEIAREVMTIIRKGRSD